MSSRLGWLFFYRENKRASFQWPCKGEERSPGADWIPPRGTYTPYSTEFGKNSTPASPESLLGFLWRTYDIFLYCLGLPTIRNKLFSLSVCRELLLCLELVVVTRFEETVLIKSFILEPLSIISMCPVCTVVRKLARRWHTFPTTSL